MKKRVFLYVILMVIFFSLAYIFGNAAFKTKTKVYVNYQDKSNINYEVALKDNDIYNDKIIGMGNSYVAEIVDYIDFTFNYDMVYDTSMNGFYSYDIDALLVAYEDDINNSLWEKEYPLLEDRVEVIDSNDNYIIKISDGIRINYQEYRKKILDFKEEYDIPVSGYLMIKFNVKNNLDFKGFRDTITDDNSKKVVIPLTYNTFRVNILDNSKKTGSYSEFSRLKDINYLFLLISAMFLSIALAILFVVVKDLVRVSERENNYRVELNKILNKYGDKIVNVQKIFNKKKYNLIYVDSFKELMDVYKKVESPISFKEVKKNYEAIFLIIENDNAWIYRMIAK